MDEDLNYEPCDTIPKGEHNRNLTLKKEMEFIGTVNAEYMPGGAFNGILWRELLLKKFPDEYIEELKEKELMVINFYSI